MKDQQVLGSELESITCSLAVNQLHHQLFPQGRMCIVHRDANAEWVVCILGDNYESAGEYISLTKIIHSPYLTIVVLGV